jgi:hypothetical protein
MKLKLTWKKLAMTVKAQNETTMSIAALVRPKSAEKSTCSSFSQIKLN